MSKFTQVSRREMDSVAEDFPGQMGFYVEDILSGEYHQHKANSRYPTASVCKVPVMVELFRPVSYTHLTLPTSDLV